MSQENSVEICNECGEDVSTIGPSQSSDHSESCSLHPSAETFDAVGFIMAFESGELKPSQIIVGMAELTKSGQIWSLQGSYYRAAQGFIAGGLFDGEGTLSEVGQQIADGLFDGVDAEDDYS